MIKVSVFKKLTVVCKMTWSRWKLENLPKIIFLSLCYRLQEVCGRILKKKSITEVTKLNAHEEEKRPSISYRILGVHRAIIFSLNSLNLAKRMSVKWWSCVTKILFEYSLINLSFREDTTVMRTSESFYFIRKNNGKSKNVVVGKKKNEPGRWANNDGVYCITERRELT